MSENTILQLIIAGAIAFAGSSIATAIHRLSDCVEELKFKVVRIADTLNELKKNTELEHVVEGTNSRSLYGQLQAVREVLEALRLVIDYKTPDREVYEDVGAIREELKSLRSSIDGIAIQLRVHITKIWAKD